MKPRFHNLLISLCLGATLFALQISILGWAHLATLGAKTALFARQTALDLLSIPSSLAWLLFYVALGVCVHAIPFALASKITTDLRARGPERLRHQASQRGFALLVALLVFGTMLAWDRHLFPRTLTLTQGTLLDSVQALAPVAISSLLLVALLTLWLATAASRRMQGTTALALAALILPGSSLLKSTSYEAGRAPDVIVLGVDSLRYDHLPTYGGIPGTAPAIDGFLSQSVSFNQAYTPMGRTFVAYMSILSGRYPSQHGVRENLWPRAMFKTDELLPHTLRDAGYTTAFALDEVRFANLDASFGFDHLIMPPPGTLELVAGNLLDTVGTNLLQVLPGSEFFLPHTVGNRALQHNYLPSLHNRKIGRIISSVPADRPLLLMAHFCIAHIPFANGPFHSTTPDAPFDDSPPGYRKALELADRQIERTLSQLKAAGRLENSIVVLLADHGEGLGMEKDRWRNGDHAELAFAGDSGFGHGTAALEDAEVRVVLGFQRYIDGKPAWRPDTSSVPASLVDVTPTLLSLLGIPSHIQFGGVPLLDSNGMVSAPVDRPVFVESGIFGDSLETLDIDTGEVVNEFAHLYQATGDLRVELVPDEIPGLLETKQRGAIRGRYGVAAIPSNRPRGCWSRTDYADRTRICREDPTTDPVIHAFSLDICAHYAADTQFHQTWCSHTKASH